MASLEGLAKSANLLLTELGPAGRRSRKLLANKTPSELRQTMAEARRR